MEQRQVNGSKTVDRALSVLGCYSPERVEIGVTELARLLAVNKAAAYRALSSLEAHGFVVLTPATRKYRLGYRVLELAALVQRQSEVRRVSLPHLRALRDLVGETVSLHVPTGDNRICVELIETIHAVRATISVGSTMPLYCGAPGLVLLAFRSDAEVVAYLERAALVPLAPHTPASPAAIWELIREVRRQGFLASEEDSVHGASGIAFPVRDTSGASVASLAVSGPTYRLGLPQLLSMVDAVRACADRISAELGFVDPSSEAANHRAA